MLEKRNNYKLAIITASDKGSRGEREDLSGLLIKEMVRDLGFVEEYVICPDDFEVLKHNMQTFIDEKQIDIIFTTGGTGFSPRDITPEATRAVIEREAPGIAETMRWESYKITPKAMLSRAVAGIRKKSLIINLPGSPKAVKECLNVIIPVLDHGMEILKGTSGECARN